MTSIYEFTDYRLYIEAQIKSSDASWGLISKMAIAAECQRSQLSRVLSGRLHLTLDQAFGLTEFWQLNDDETQYFLKLVEMARAGRKSYRDQLAKEISQIQKSQEDLSRRLSQPPPPSSEIESFYYSNWTWAAIHILVSIPEYQNVKRISERLSLPVPMVEDTLHKLNQLGLVEKKGSVWSYTAQTTHLSKNSPHIVAHHSNWRSRAVLDAQMSSSDGLHYTMVQSVSKKDFEKLKHSIIKMIENYNRVAGASKEEELICFNCDFFRV